MGRHLLIFIWIAVSVLIGCSSGGGGGGSSDSESDKGPLESILSSISKKMENREVYTREEIEYLVSDARAYFESQGLTDSRDISLVGNSLLYSITNTTLAREELSLSSSNKIDVINLANQVFLRLLDQYAADISTTRAQTLSDTSTDSATLAKYAYALNGFAAASIMYLDEAGIDDYEDVWAAAENVLSNLIFYLYNCSLESENLGSLVQTTVEGAVSAAQDSGLADAYLQKFMAHAVLGAIGGNSDLLERLEADEDELDFVYHILQGALEGLNDIPVTGDLLELAVIGMKEGLSEGLDDWLDLDSSERQAFYDNLDSNSDFSLLSSRKISLSTEIETTEIPVGASYEVEVKADYYASDDEVVITDDCTFQTSSKFSFANNKVTALALGEGTLTVSYGSLSETTSLSAIDATVTGLSISPQITSLPVGQEKIFKAVATYSSDSTADVSDSTVWSVDQEDSCELYNNGRFSCSAIVTAEISVSYGGFEDSLEVQITSVELSSLEVLPQDVTQPSGKEQQFYLYKVYTDDTKIKVESGVTWTNADATGLADITIEGVYTITAQYDGESYTATLTVTEKELEALVVSPENYYITLGDETSDYSATGVYTDGTTVDKTDLVKWETEDTDLAVIFDYRSTIANGYLTTAFSSKSINKYASTTVTASCDEDCDADLYDDETITQSTFIYVTGDDVTSVSLSQTSLTIDVAETVTLDVTMLLENTYEFSISDHCTFEASNSNISVNNEQITGSTAGNSTLTVTCGQYVRTATVTVQE
jgi:hypothetical protein